MNTLNPDFNNLLEYEGSDLLAAMKKLTQIIQVDGEFDGIKYNQPIQHSNLPPQINKNSFQGQISTPPNRLHEQVDLIQGLKSVANEISRLDARTVGDESMIKSNRKLTNQSVSINQNSQYVSFAKEKKADKCSSIVNRLYDMESQKREKLAALQFKRYKEELSTLRDKPEISFNSKIIAQQQHNQPIYERSLLIMKQRNENINRLRKQLEDAGERSISPSFQPDLSCTKRSNNERARTPEEFYAQVNVWQRRRNEALQKEQYEIMTRQLVELPFKPKIDDNSRNIVEKNKDNLPVELRLQKHKEHIEKKKKQLLEREKPSFKPTINQKSQDLAKNRKLSTEKGYKIDRSLNTSLVDALYIRENIRRKASPEVRKLTPEPNLKVNARRNTSGNLKKNSHFNEINFTPAVDFLLRKLE